MDVGEHSSYGEVDKVDLNRENLLAAINADAAALGFLFEPSGVDNICPPDTYKVALALDEYDDYHWYRQNRDGTWSHKLADRPVTDLDASGNIIWDPATANRYHQDISDYSIFIGYFNVYPLNLPFIA